MNTISSIKKNTAQQPRHIAIIMDGNRRWAEQHKLELLKGHERVATTIIQELTEHCIKIGVPYLTLWAFSTENWHRDTQEVMGIMDLFRSGFKKNARELHEKGVRLTTIGDLSFFPGDIQKNIAEWVRATEKNTAITVTLALNYGGRDEIIRAVNKVMSQRSGSGTLATEITQAEFSHYLDTAALPDPDLIIRPGGEKRVSGYLPWQSVYSELYFTDTLMPDFGAEQLDEALADFAQRQRRFGK